MSKRVRRIAFPHFPHYPGEDSISGHEVDLMANPGYKAQVGYTERGCP